MSTPCCKSVLLALALCLAWLAGPARAESGRVALVIGNAGYEAGRLLNPRNDAADVAAALQRLGFTVISGSDLDREGMLRKVQAFRAALRPGGIALVFYSGHGIEVGGKNYLLPVNNGSIRTVEDVEIHGYEAQNLVRQMEGAQTQLNIVILDACRDNPLPSTVRSASKGLARMDAQQGTLIAYATREGQTAADGAGRNSPYTSALLRYLGQPGLEVSQLFNRVGLEVARATGNRQVPWTSSSPVPPIQLGGGSSKLVQGPAQGGADVGSSLLAAFAPIQAPTAPEPSWMPEECVPPHRVQESAVQESVAFAYADVLEAVPRNVGGSIRYRVDYQYRGEKFSFPDLSYQPGRKLRVRVVVRPDLTGISSGRSADVLRAERVFQVERQGNAEQRDLAGFDVEFRYRGEVYFARLACDPGSKLPMSLTVNPVDV